MAITNQTIAELLNQIADKLETTGDNRFKIRAYRRAAISINQLVIPIEDLIQIGSDLTTISYVGKGIARQIRLIVQTKEIPELKRIEVTKPKFLNELLLIEGLGSKRVKMLADALNIKSVAQLKKAIELGKLTKIKGFNDKLQNKMYHSILSPKKYEIFTRLYHAIPVIETILFHLREMPDVTKVIAGGDYRRKQEVVGNVNILCVTANPASVFDKFIHFPELKEIVKINKKQVIARLHYGMQISLDVISPRHFEPELLFSTGSLKHIKQLIEIAKKNHAVLTKKGLLKSNKRIAKTEKDIYKQLGLEYITPELRENRGEIEVAQKYELPKLIQLEDIKGDLHSHTNETDGRESLEAMINGAIEKGYEYLAITDHSKRLAITNGMDEKRLLKQIKLIDKLNEKYAGSITILKSIEVDILEDGSLDLSDDVLKELDLRVCSIHSRFRLTVHKQTERILRAIDNRYFNILGHATGRLIKSRNPYELDIEKIFRAAKERNCFIELNAQPYRLDIKDEYCKMAKSIGVKIAISSDAHSRREFNFMQLGIYQARRGWLEKGDVINTRSLNDLLKLLKK